MPFIAGISFKAPLNRYEHAEVLSEFLSALKELGANQRLIERIYRNSGVKTKHLAYPLNEYRNFGGMQDRNDRFLAAAVPLIEASLTELLATAGIGAESISLLTTATVTGLAIPSLDARLMNRLPFRRDTKRLPIFGLGCVAGVAGINRVADYLAGHPQEAAIFSAVELCSLSWQPSTDLANVVSTSLFGDGCASVLLCGDEHPLREAAPFEIVDYTSEFLPDTERTMGFDVADEGLLVVLSASVPDVVRNELAPVVTTLREKSHYEQPWDFYVCHPGGPKVIKAIEATFKLEHNELKQTWDSLSDNANMSSVSVLDILRRTAQLEIPAGQNGVMTAMGPAFCIEATHLRKNHH